jgi:two-component system, NarL family, sensor histidine kinase UhpB
MKKITCLLFLLFSIVMSVNVFSQQSKMDSLLQVLNTANEDSNKVNTLNALGRETRNTGDYEVSRKYSSEALLLSEKIHFEKGKIAAYINTGVTYYFQNNFSVALENLSIALSISTKLKDRLNIANCNNNMALVYTYQGNYSKALANHKAALKSYEELEDTAGMIRSYFNTGIVYFEQGNYPEALESYLSTLKLAEKAGDKKGIAGANLNIGGVYIKQKKYSEGLQMYSSALKLYEELGAKHQVGSCYVQMAQVYADLKEYKKALETSQAAIYLLEQVGDPAGMAQAKDVRSDVFLELNNYEEAVKILLENLKTYRETGDSANTANALNNIGYAYLKQKKYGEAINYIQSGLSLAQQTGTKERISYSYLWLAESYEGANDYKNAYKFQKLYTSLSDSMFNETKNNQIEEMKTRYETEKKDNDIALLSKDKELQDVEIKKQKQLKYSFIGGLGLVIVLMLFGYRTYRARQALRLQDIRNKISGDLHDDIGSTLNSISIYSEVARKKDSQQDEALEMIGEASRKIIDAMSDIVWTVNPENDSFAKIIFRMKSLAYNLFRAKKIEFTFHSDEVLNEKKLSLEERRNFYLIFKEAINNLVKYSNASSSAIALLNENGYIKLSIRDNGVGFDPSDEIIGNGLKNMKRRADEMKAQFKIESGKGNGTQIELKLKA